MEPATLPDVTRRQFITLTGSALAGTVLAASAPATVAAQAGARKTASKTSKKGGTLKVAIIGEPPALDPGFTTATITTTTMYTMQQHCHPPPPPPPLREMVRSLAQRGGFFARQGDGEPGIKAIWQGYQRLHEFLYALDTYRSINA